MTDEDWLERSIHRQWTDEDRQWMVNRLLQPEIVARLSQKDITFLVVTNKRLLNSDFHYTERQDNYLSGLYRRYALQGSNGRQRPTPAPIPTPAPEIPCPIFFIETAYWREVVIPRMEEILTAFKQEVERRTLIIGEAANR
jgi:hypothetical protein